MCADFQRSGIYTLCSALLSDPARLVWLLSPTSPVLADQVSKHFHCVNLLQQNIRLPDFTLILHLCVGYQAFFFFLI